MEDDQSLGESIKTINIRERTVQQGLQIQSLVQSGPTVHAACMGLFLTHSGLAMLGLCTQISYSLGYVECAPGDLYDTSEARRANICHGPLRLYSLSLYLFIRF